MTVAAAEVVVEAVVGETVAAGAGAEAGVGGLLSKLKNVAGYVGPLKSVASAFMSLGDSADEAGKKVERTFTTPLDEIETFSGKIKSVTDVNFDLLAGQALQLADHIHDVSQQTGIAAEDLSVLNAAASDNGMSLDTLAASLGTFGSSIDGALGDDSKMRQTFAALGVTWEELKTKSPRDVLLDAANGLANISDPATRAAAAHELFGDKAAQMVPLLVSLANDGYKKVAAEAEGMGRIVSGPAAASADEFDKNLMKLKGSLVGAANVVLSAALPAINAFTSLLIYSGDQGWTRFLNPMYDVMQVAKILSVVIAGLGGTFSAAINAGKTFFSGLREAWKFDAPPDILAKVSAQLDKDGQELRNRVKGIWSPGVNAPEKTDRTPLHPEVQGPPAPPPAWTPPAPLRLVMPTYNSINTNTTRMEQNAPSPALAEVKEEARLLPVIVSHMKEKLAAATAAAEAAQRELTTAQRAADIDFLRAHTIMTTAEVQKVADIQKLNALDEYNKKKAEHERDAAKANAEVNAEPMADLSDVLAYASAKQKIADRQRDADAASERQYQSRVTQINVEEATNRNKSLAALHYNTQLEMEVNDLHFAEVTAAILGTPVDKMAVQMVEKHKAALERMEQNNKRMAGDMGAGLTTIFDTVLKGGNIDNALKSVVDKFRSTWSSAFGEMVNHWMSELQRIANGQPKMVQDPNDATRMIPETVDGTATGAPNVPSQTAQKWARGGMYAYEGATAAYGLYQAGQSGVGKGANALSGAAQGAMIGTKIYPGIGTVVGAIVGAIVGYATGTDKQGEYKYGNPNISKTGQVSMFMTKNMNDSEVKEWVAKIQDQYSTFWNGYVNVLLKLPGSTLPTMESINGKFQDNP
ncbi:MAG: hypothetical protein JWO56_3248, partial [Acidobacteria bacterium]|nr:hypothetical protein [Acidobacteriota bacterium]